MSVSLDKLPLLMVFGGIVCYSCPEVVWRITNMLYMSVCPNICHKRQVNFDFGSWPDSLYALFMVAVSHKKAIKLKSTIIIMFFLSKSHQLGTHARTSRASKEPESIYFVLEIRLTALLVTSFVLSHVHYIIYTTPHTHQLPSTPTFWHQNAQTHPSVKPLVQTAH